MNISSRKIIVDDNTAVSSEWAISRHYDRNLALVIAHGAGNDMHNPLLSYIHRSVAEKGLLCVKFNFPYKELGRRAPDHPILLMRTWRAVIKELTTEPNLSPAKIVLSGKSLGGRMASMVAAEDGGIDGLVFFGYPLHPAKQTEKLRVSHLGNIRCPMLFFQGTRDPLCQLGLFRQYVLDPYAKQTTLHVIEGGDHSFNVAKKMNRTVASIWQEIATQTIAWISRLN